MTAITNQEIDSGLARARDVRAKTLEVFAELTQEQLDRKPAQSKWIFGDKAQWSLGEHADHVLRVESYIRTEVIGKLIEMAKTYPKPILQKSLKDLKLISTAIPRILHWPAEKLINWSNQLSARFVPRRVTEFAFRYSRFPATNPESWAPRVGRSADELRAELSESLSKMEALFEENADADFASMIFKHTVVGSHTVPQMLRISSIHEEWHQDRFAELLKD
ncbi:MAG: hypothetical protein ACI8UO_001321 [Verrucomicrobiales bacterium]|jgi:hypothetical protein